ncbi:TIGR04222 domain-containing membrane protein [Streptomyces sp. NPDC002785]|uniref:TIGR04222 domain-containing membrane protein n=1 Tax=Streptomyces sp. NPDC002785 TaxID=3154543 RepID=UPI0033188BA8
MNTLAVLMDLGIVVSSVLLIVGVTRARGGSGGSVHDLFEVAFLNGGPGRVVDTALTAMQTDGRLAIGGPGIVAVQQVDARDPVERAVLQEHAMAPTGALHTLRHAVMRHPAVQEIGDGLAARGLLTAPAANRTWGRWGVAQGLVCLLAIPVSVPIIFKVLPALLVGIPIGFVCAGLARGRVTRAGRQAAEAYRTAHAYNPHPAHLVATHGLRALPDPVLRAQLMATARMRPAGRPLLSGSRSSSSSDSSGMFVAPAVWCAGTGPGRGSCGSSHDGGSSSGGGGCSSGSSCGSGSSCSSGSGCGGSSGSSCSSSSGSSCSSSSGSSCSSSSGSSCGGGSSCGSSS